MLIVRSGVTLAATGAGTPRNRLTAPTKRWRSTILEQIRQQMDAIRSVQITITIGVEKRGVTGARARSCYSTEEVTQNPDRVGDIESTVLVEVTRYLQTRRWTIAVGQAGRAVTGPCLGASWRRR